MMEDATRPPNPWFSVVDRETFELEVDIVFLEDEVGPCGFEPDFAPIDYFEKFLKTEDDDLFDRIVEETNRYYKITFSFLGSVCLFSFCFCSLLFFTYNSIDITFHAKLFF